MVLLTAIFLQNPNTLGIWVVFSIGLGNFLSYFKEKPQHKVVNCIYLLRMTGPIFEILEGAVNYFKEVEGELHSEVFAVMEEKLVKYSQHV